MNPFHSIFVLRLRAGLPILGLAFVLESLASILTLYFSACSIGKGNLVSKSNLFNGLMFFFSFMVIPFCNLCPLPSSHVYASYGGLLMDLEGNYKHLGELTQGLDLYLLLRKKD